MTFNPLSDRLTLTNMDRKKDWQNVNNIEARSYTCGYSECGKEVSSEKGWTHPRDSDGNADGIIQVCPQCRRPTLFDTSLGIQIPGVSLGNNVNNLPSEIEILWSEIRKLTSHNAYTSAVLSGRKLLMHIAVAQGAKAGISFVEYVDYLVTNHFAPPNSKEWVDKIRSHGNEATHEVIIKKKEDAEEIMTFLEMLLKFIYEFPARSKIKPTLTVSE